MPAASRLGDESFCPADSHGGKCCPHPVRGPAVEASTDVFINGLGALRVGDTGIHAACCNRNSWKAEWGSPGVFVNGKAQVRVGDMTRHCGGAGTMQRGSYNVAAGGKTGGATDAKPAKMDLDAGFEWFDGTPVKAGRAVRILDPGRSVVSKGSLDSDSRATARQLDGGVYGVEFDGEEYIIIPRPLGSSSEHEE